MQVLGIALCIQLYFQFSCAYKTLSSGFLQNISKSVADADLVGNTILPPILQPRVVGSQGHRNVQTYFTEFFGALPKWSLRWQNSTMKYLDGSLFTTENLLFSREPPWTRPGQTNFLTFAAHYDSYPNSTSAIDGAIPCALLLHIARSLDRYITQMHDEMAALNEGGTEDMDMGVQLIFLDGKFGVNGQPYLYGSRSLAAGLEQQLNPVDLFPNALSQIRLLVLLDNLGLPQPTVPSYLKTTRWAHKKLTLIDERLSSLQEPGQGQSRASIFESVDMDGTQAPSDHTAFAERGVPYLHIQPQNNRSPHDENLDETFYLPIVRRWAMILQTFALEWLDMMEVWPEEG